MLTEQNLVDYEILENGKIKSNISGKTLAIADNGSGYKKVSLRGKQFYVHRLVAYMHIPNPHGYTEINHIDGDKSNNHKDNLEWCTRSHNRQHAVAMGLWKSPRAMAGRFGENNPHSKPVTQLTKDGVYIKTFPGVKEAARQLGYKSASQITNCIAGKSLTSGGYKWRY